MQPSVPSTSARQWFFDICFLSIVFIVFYSLWLGSYPLFTPDEGRYSEVAREMIATGDYITPRVNGVAFLDKPILYYWLQAAAMNLFGIKEWALRFFPMLLGVMTCCVMYGCGRYVFNRRTGILAAMVLATTPLFFGGAHYANLDLEVAAWISCTLLFFLCAIQPASKARTYFLCAAYLCAALAFLTKGMIGLAFPALIAGSWIAINWRWDLLRKIHLIKGIILFIAIVLPWYVLAQKANPQFFHYFFITQQITRFLSAADFNNKTPFWFYVPVLLAGCFPWTIFLVQALYKNICDIMQKREHYQNGLYVLLWFVIVFAFFSIPRSKTIGYILSVVPAFALIIGYYLSCQWEKVKAPGTYWAIINYFVLSCLVAITLLLLPQNNIIEIPIRFIPYLKAMEFIFAGSASISLTCLFNQAKVKQLCILTGTSSVLTLLVLVMGAHQLNQNSAKPLVTQLQTLIKPGDEVVNYFKFYQDIPVYLGKRVTLVADWQSPDIAKKDNWVRELWYGMEFQNTDDWLINEKIFWQRWEKKKRMFVFLNENYFQQFKNHTPHYYLLGTHNEMLLLSNEPSVD